MSAPTESRSTGPPGSFGAAIAIVGLPLAERDWRLPYALTLPGLLLLPVLVRRLEESPLVRSSEPATRVLSGLLAGDITPMVLSRWHRRTVPERISRGGLAFTTERLVGDLGMSTGTAILIALGGGTIGGVGFFLGGRLSDSWGRRPTTVLALVAILVGGLGIYHFEATWMLVASIVVSSFGSFAYVPAASTHRAELFPTESRRPRRPPCTGSEPLAPPWVWAWAGCLIDGFGLTADPRPSGDRRRRGRDPDPVPTGNEREDARGP